MAHPGLRHNLVRIEWKEKESMTRIEFEVDDKYEDFQERTQERRVDIFFKVA